MAIWKREFGRLPTRKLMPIAAGEFMGILSSPREIRLSKKELRRRGLL